MIYEYKCQECDKSFDIIKTISEFDRKEHCPICQKEATRQFSRKIYISGASVQHAEYNPGLGCVVKNKYHRQELCKEKGLIEIGNDFSSGSKMVESFDKARAEKHKKEWEKV